MEHCYVSIGSNGSSRVGSFLFDPGVLSFLLLLF